MDAVSLVDPRFVSQLDSVLNANFKMCVVHR